MVQAAEPLSARSLNCLGFDGAAFELDEKCASGFLCVLDSRIQKCWWL